MRSSGRIVALLLATACALCAAPPRTVVVYCAVDEVFARPLLAEFERTTGIDVREVFDSESTKSVGLAVRLVQEKGRPRADVFWNGEFSRTIFLKRNKVLARYASPAAKTLPARFRDADHQWAGHAVRTRVLAYNPERVKTPPKSIFELTKPAWRNRAAICDPLIGTAAAWATALYCQLGDDRADAYFRDLQRNGVKILPGNSVVADYVVKGLVEVGITDSDDVFVRQQQGKSIKAVLPDADRLGTLAIPTTVALINRAPHPYEAKQLIDFLLSPRVEQALAQSAGHLSVRGEALVKLKLIDVPFDEIGARVDAITRRLARLLGR